VARSFLVDRLAQGELAPLRSCRQTAVFHLLAILAHCGIMPFMPLHFRPF